MAKCEVDIDEDCTGIATHIVSDGGSQTKSCHPCSDHSPGDATIEPISKAFRTGWSVVKQPPEPSQKATDAMAMFQQVQEAKRKRMAMQGGAAAPAAAPAPAAPAGGAGQPCPACNGTGKVGA